MSNFFLIIIFLFSLTSCKTNNSDMEICFEHFQNRIGSDSILKKLMLSPIDSYGNFASIINRAVTEESKSNSICKTTLSKFLLDNKENSITVNNLIFFQQFQAYLKHEKFDKPKARNIALKFEEKWK
jgi:hypothetical protein